MYIYIKILYFEDIYCIILPFDRNAYLDIISCSPNSYSKHVLLLIYI